MNSLLVITVGQTDVQLVMNNQRHKFDGNSCGILHDEIEKRAWSVVDAPIERSRDFATAFRVDGSTTEESRGIGLEGKRHFVRVGEQDGSTESASHRIECRRLIKALSDNEIALCTPKLDAVLERLRSSLPSEVLILETTRSHPREPRLAGKVMKKRLSDRGVENVTCIPFLTGNEHLEDSSNELDAVVRRSVVATLSSAIRDATENLTIEDCVWVAPTGGLSAANELISELVRLHCVAGPTVNALEVPDRARAELPDEAVEEKFHPAAGYRARWHALSLVEKGNFLAAWGAVNHLESGPGQEWTKVIDWLRYFASSLPVHDDCNIDVLKNSSMAVRAALRVELALRAGDIPRAVHGTVAFFEAALWDGLNERFERSEDPKRRRYFKVKSGEAPTGNKLLRTGDENDKDEQTRPFELKDTIDGVKWYRIYDDSAPAGRLAKRFLKRSGLQKYNSALSDDIRSLRNDVAHNEPTPQLMDDAKTRMRDAGLWSADDGFLSQTLVQDVLKEQNVPEPEKLLDNLLAEVRQRLLCL